MLTKLTDVPMFIPSAQRVVVIVDASVSFDGSVTSSEVMNVTVTDEAGGKLPQDDGSAFGEALANRVSLWRYRPPLKDGCAGDVSAIVIQNVYLSEVDEPAVYTHIGPFLEPEVEETSQAPVREGYSPVTKVKDVPPAYPPIAQSRRVQGVVALEAVIGLDGRVTNVDVLRSIPLLDGAAVSAVLQWEYTPTLLDGVPVPVIMTVTLTFTLE